MLRLRFVEEVPAGGRDGGWLEEVEADVWDGEELARVGW